MKTVAHLIFLIILCLQFHFVHADADFDISKYKGKVVYVDFWASWCAPCRASFPFMRDMVVKYGDSLAVVAINVDNDRNEANRFLEQYDVNFDIVYDPQGNLAEKFEVKGMPTSYLYNEKGQLLGSHIGFRKKESDRLESAIKDAIRNAN